MLINRLNGKSIFDLVDNQLIDTNLKMEKYREIKVDGENVGKLISKLKQAKQPEMQSMRESFMNREIRDNLGTPARWLFQLKNISPQSGRS